MKQIKQTRKYVSWVHGTQRSFVLYKGRMQRLGQPSRRTLKVNYNIKTVSRIDIELDNTFLKAGNVFLLIDAYKQGKCVFATITTDQDARHDVGWEIPKGKRIKNRNDLKLFLEKFLFQVVVIDD